MPITVCVPLFEPHIKFLPHFVEWYAANKQQHDLRLAWGYRRPLHHVQAGSVLLARSTKSSHILFVEDDHHSFPVDGLEVLLDADKPVIGFHTISRKHPYHALCMRKIDPDLTMIQAKEKNMRPFERVSADQPEVQECDLLSWAFTLVRTDVFDQLAADPFEVWGAVPTDSYFCQYCEDAGIPRYVHFGYSIPHGEARLENRPFLQRMASYERMIKQQGQLPSDEEKSTSLIEPDLQGTDYARQADAREGARNADQPV